MVLFTSPIMSSLKKKKETKKKTTAYMRLCWVDECKKEYKRRQEYKENMRFDQIG